MQYSVHMVHLHVCAMDRLGLHIRLHCDKQGLEFDMFVVYELVMTWRIIMSGTREAAFVYAISSAGVAFAVTRACSSGDLEKCGCDRTVHGVSPQGFQWSGCSDNIAYGVAFSQSFVDVRERSKGASSSRALMNLHNNEAGRKAILNNMRVECKCHGVSGSCEVKTCWKAMPPFRKVGNVLKEKFDGATEVEQKKNWNN
ncbi:unnamed protein product [Ranitomeya imitator]|uniref:Protein Wnt n=1 Tax=Ranitomeya imitator TaxID=111125 RepID=A0ABN9KYW3_9NEOB|nr:unnamed protein product [Ranitomeya imitator]